MVLADLRKITTALRPLAAAVICKEMLILFIGIIVVGYCFPTVKDCILQPDCVIFLHSEICTVSLLETQCTEWSLISSRNCSWTYSVDSSSTHHHPNSVFDKKSFNVTAEELISKGCKKVTVRCRDENEVDNVHFEIVFLLEGSEGTCPTSTTPVTSIEHSVTDVPSASPTIASSVTTTTHMYATTTITVTETPTHTPTTNNTHEFPGWAIALVIGLIPLFLLCCLWPLVMLFILGLLYYRKSLKSRERNASEPQPGTGQPSQPERDGETFANGSS